MYCCRVSEKKISSLITKRKYNLVLFQSLNFYTSLAAQKVDFHDKFTATDSYYAELKHQMQFYATSGCVREALAALNSMKMIHGRPSVYDYNALIHSLFMSNNVVCNDLVCIYIDMKRYGPCPNALTYNTLLSGLLSHGLFDHVVSISEEMLTSGFVPSFTVMSNILKKLLKSNNLVIAFGVFKFMLRLNYLPTDSILNILINRLSKSGLISEAYFVFSVLFDQGYFRGAFNYNPILWSLCKCGQSHTALQFLYLFKKKGIVHDVRSYAALIYGFGKEKLELEAMRCFKEMINEGCKPNKVTHTIIMKFLCDNGKLKEGLNLLSSMEKEGPQPDLISYNIILRELCQQGKIDEIIKIIKIPQEKGLVLDSYTHAALAGGLVKAGKIRMASKFLLDFSFKNCKVDTAICNIYLNIWCQQTTPTEILSPCLNEALKIFDCSGIEPNVISYNTILKSLSASDIDRATDLVDRIDWGKNGPDIVSFNTILSEACKQNNSPMIQRLSDRMEIEGIEHNVVGATCLIQYYGENGKVSEGIKLLKSMIISGPNPTLVTLNTFINSLCKNGASKVAYGFFRSMRCKGFTMDLTTYNILLRASVIERNYQLTCHFLREMCLEGLEPDSFTFSTFVYWLLKEDKISSALKFLCLMIEEGISPGIGVYNLIMKAMLERGKLIYVIKLVKKMVAEGCEPNEATFEIIDTAISKGWIKGYTESRILVSVLSSIGKRRDG